MVLIVIIAFNESPTTIKIRMMKGSNGRPIASMPERIAVLIPPLLA